MSNKARKYLLLIDEPPNDNTIEGRLLVDLCKFILPNEIEIYCVRNPVVTASIPNDLSEIPVIYKVKPDQKARSQSDLINILKYLKITFGETQVISNDIKEKVRVGGFTDVIVGIRGQAMAQIAKSLKNIRNINLFPIVWDGPNKWNEENKLPTFCRELFSRTMSSVLKCSDAVLYMPNALSGNHGYELRSGDVEYDYFDVSKLKSLTADMKHDKEEDFKVLIYQNAIPTETFKFMISMFDKMHWKIDGVPIRLSIIGTTIPTEILPYKPYNIHLLGFQKPENIWRQLLNATVIIGMYQFDMAENEISNYVDDLYFRLIAMSGRPYIHLGSITPSIKNHLTDMAQMHVIETAQMSNLNHILRTADLRSFDPSLSEKPVKQTKNTRHDFDHEEHDQNWFFSRFLSPSKLGPVMGKGEVNDG